GLSALDHLEGWDNWSLENQAKLYIRNSERTTISHRTDAEQARVSHSYRKAAMGSSRDAFSAGHIPKKSPMLVPTVKPATTDHTGTVEGRLGMNVRIVTLSSQPTTMPITPPDAVRVIASNRNCHVISLRRAPTALRT